MTGVVPWFMGRLGEGLPSLVRAVELDPENLLARWCLGYTHTLVGDVEAGTKHAEVLRTKSPDLPYTRHLLALVAALSGQSEAALKHLASVEGLDGHHKMHLAEAFAMAGDIDRALSLLEEAVKQGFHPYYFIAEYCPFMAPLRGLPRFEALAARAQRLTAEFGIAGGNS